jgi:hypothetical protein
MRVTFKNINTNKFLGGKATFNVAFEVRVNGFYVGHVRHNYRQELWQGNVEIMQTPDYLPDHACNINPEVYGKTTEEEIKNYIKNKIIAVANRVFYNKVEVFV